MNKRKKSHISIYFTRIFFSSGQQSHFPVQQPPSRLFLFSASFLSLTNDSLILFSSLSSLAFTEFSINSLLRESTNYFTPSLFHSYSLISLSKICSVSFKICSFCFNKKAWCHSKIYFYDILVGMTHWKLLRKVN